MKSKTPKTIEETRRFVEMTARHNGWRINSNDRFLSGIISGLTKNYNRFGYYQCPCRDSWDGDREKDADIICPCDYCVADLAEYGHCLCGLFLSDSFADSGNPVRPIPERRKDERFP